MGTRVDRRRQRTRERILEAARGLIAEKGVAGLRIQEITDEADVALGTFYNYFENKDALVEAVVADSLSALGEATVARDAVQDPAVTASAAIRRVVRLAFEDPGFARLVVNLHNADTLFSRSFEPFARQVVEHGIAAQRFNSPDVAASVSLVVGSSMALLRGILEGEHREGVEKAHAELSLRALGIAPEEARRISRLRLR